MVMILILLLAQTSFVVMALIKMLIGYGGCTVCDAAKLDVGEYRY